MKKYPNTPAMRIDRSEYNREVCSSRGREKNSLKICKPSARELNIRRGPIINQTSYIANNKSSLLAAAFNNRENLKRISSIGVVRAEFQMLHLGVKCVTLPWHYKWQVQRDVYIFLTSVSATISRTLFSNQNLRSCRGIGRNSKRYLT